MVTWNTSQSVLHDGHMVTGANDPAILAVADQLFAAGGTDLSAGLFVKGYQLAQANYGQDRLNRVVLISDGGANAGVTDQNLIAMNSADADQEGIYLAGVGVGPAPSYNDSLMDTVTDKGRGAYVYLDGPDEATRMFVDRFAETFDIAARSVQMQLTMPWYFTMKKFYGEAYSSNAAAIEPQHLAPSDAMIFEEVIGACDASQIHGSDTISVHATWTEPVTYVPRTTDFSITIDQMLAAAGPGITKGKAIVGYAEALKTGTSNDLHAALDAVNAANVGGGGPGAHRDRRAHPAAPELGRPRSAHGRLGAARELLDEASRGFELRVEVAGAHRDLHVAAADLVDDSRRAHHGVVDDDGDAVLHVVAREDAEFLAAGGSQRQVDGPALGIALGVRRDHELGVGHVGAVEDRGRAHDVRAHADTLEEAPRLVEVEDVLRQDLLARRQLDGARGPRAERRALLRHRLVRRADPAREVARLRLAGADGDVLDLDRQARRVGRAGLAPRTEHVVARVVDGDDADDLRARRRMRSPRGSPSSLEPPRPITGPPRSRASPRSRSCCRSARRGRGARDAARLVVGRSVRCGARAERRLEQLRGARGVGRADHHHERRKRRVEGIEPPKALASHEELDPAGLEHGARIRDRIRPLVGPHAREVGHAHARAQLCGDVERERRRVRHDGEHVPARDVIGRASPIANSATANSVDVTIARPSAARASISSSPSVPGAPAALASAATRLG